MNAASLTSIEKYEQLQPVIVQEQKTRRGRCLTKTKVVSVSYVSFNCFKSREDPVGYDFGMYEVINVMQFN